MRNISAVLAFVFLFVSVAPSFAEEKPLTLEDLGFTKADTQANLNLQKQLETRTTMLKVHQTLGLVTAIPMAAQFFDKGNIDLHKGIGITTATLYATTASFALFAPKPEGVKDKGKTKIHRMLAFVHAPLMILTPVLGAIADDQKSKGERVHGIASLHSASAGVLLASYLASIAVMSFNF